VASECDFRLKKYVIIENTKKGVSPVNKSIFFFYVNELW